MKNKKKYLSIRINTQAAENVRGARNKTYRGFGSQVKHNLRIEKMDDNYLKKPKNTQHNYHYNFLNKSKTDNILFEDLKNEIKKMKEDYKKHSYRGRKLPKNTKPIINGLITFSKEMSTDIKKYFNPHKDLKQLDLKTHIKDFIEIRFGKCLTLDLHLDETTPHFHFHTINYDFKQHRTHSKLLSTELNNKDNKNRVNSMQDDLELYLKEKIEGWDYERGEINSVKEKLTIRQKYQNQIEGLEKEKEQMKESLSLEQMKLNKLEQENKKMIEDNEELKKLYNESFEILDQFMEVGLNYKNKSNDDLKAYFERYFKSNEKSDKFKRFIQKLEKQLKTPKSKDSLSQLSI